MTFEVLAIWAICFLLGVVFTCAIEEWGGE